MKFRVICGLVVVFSSASAVEISKPYQPVIEQLKEIPALEETESTEVIDQGEAQKLGGPVGVSNESLLLSDDATRLETAKNLEQFFYDNFSDFYRNTNSMYDDSNVDAANKRWADKTYGGLVGVRLYHYYDEYFALGRMIRLSSAVNPDHTSTYIDMALEGINFFAPRLINGDGTKYCGSAKSRYYCNASPPQHRFLDATRGMAWLGYLMDSILLVEPGYADEFKEYAIQMKPVLERHASHAYKTTHIHMGTHVGFAADLLGRIGGYRKDFDDEIKAVINDAMLGNIAKSKWITSDIGHAEMSVNFLHYVYDQQKRGNVIPGQKMVELEHMETVGKTFLSRINENHPTAFRFTEKNIGEYGLLARGSSQIEAKLIAPEKYELGSPTGSHRFTEAISTIASFAYGLAYD